MTIVLTKINSNVLIKIICKSCGEIYGYVEGSGDYARQGYCETCGKIIQEEMKHE